MATVFALFKHGATSLPYDIVLGRDWLLLCRDALMYRSFGLTSGSVEVNAFCNAD
jgi:hypothetical protein